MRSFKDVETARMKHSVVEEKIDWIEEMKTQLLLFVLDLGPLHPSNPTLCYPIPPLAALSGIKKSCHGPWKLKWSLQKVTPGNEPHRHEVKWLQALGTPRSKVEPSAYRRTMHTKMWTAQSVWSTPSIHRR